MEDIAPKIETKPEAAVGSSRTYIAGYLASIALTVAAYLLVRRHVHSQHFIYPHDLLVPVLAGLAILQVAIQLFAFLHLGKGSRARWNVVVLLFMLLVVGIIVIGSLWIMHNLNYRMTPQEVNTYLKDQNGGI